MPKNIRLKSGKYQLFQLNKDALSFEEWLKKFYGNSSDKEFIEKDLNKKEIKQNPTLPIFLSHCSYSDHIEWIIKDRKLGGREVTSGQVVLTPKIIHFSVIPLLTGHYDLGIVFKTQNLINNNPDKNLTPTLYRYQYNNINLYFDNEGWQQRIKQKDDRKRFEIINSGFHEEREWNMEANINFDLEDIEAILTNSNYKDDRYSILNGCLANLDSLKKLYDFYDFFKQYNRLKNRLFYFNRDISATTPSKHNQFLYKLEKLIEDNDEKIVILRLKGIIEKGMGDVELALSEKELKGMFYEEPIKYRNYDKIKRLFSQGIIVTKENLVYWE